MRYNGDAAKDYCGQLANRCAGWERMVSLDQRGSVVERSLEAAVDSTCRRKLQMDGMKEKRMDTLSRCLVSWRMVNLSMAIELAVGAKSKILKVVDGAAVACSGRGR